MDRSSADRYSSAADFAAALTVDPVASPSRRRFSWRTPGKVALGVVACLHDRWLPCRLTAIVRRRPIRFDLGLWNHDIAPDGRLLVLPSNPEQKARTLGVITCFSSAIERVSPARPVGQ